MPRINSMRWPVIADHIRRTVLACPGTTGRVYKMTANAMVLQIITYRPIYEDCLVHVVEDLGGVEINPGNPERIGSRALGNEWRCTFLFTQDPERAKQITLEDLE